MTESGKTSEKRTPRQILGHDAYAQLVFEGYEVVPLAAPFECEDCLGMSEHGCYCEAMGASHPGGGPVSTVDGFWRELCEKDDRTSPAEYPDMVLITKNELADFIGRATPIESAPAAGVKALRDALVEADEALHVIVGGSISEEGEPVEQLELIIAANRECAANAEKITRRALAATPSSPDVELQAEVEKLRIERDAHLEELGRVIMACPMSPTFRTSPPHAGVKALRAEFEAAEARASSAEKALADAAVSLDPGGLTQWSKRYRAVIDAATLQSIRGGEDGR